MLAATAVTATDVCERVDRQLQSIGDALAWHMLGYDRAVIVALSRNQEPGPMAGKAGLAREREFVAEWSEDEDSFVLLHDITSCLRIGDATLFRSVGSEFEAYLYEIKTNPDKRKTGQLRRKRLAEEALHPFDRSSPATRPSRYAPARSRRSRRKNAGATTRANMSSERSSHPAGSTSPPLGTTAAPRSKRTVTSHRIAGRPSLCHHTAIN